MSAFLSDMQFVGLAEDSTPLNWLQCEPDEMSTIMVAHDTGRQGSSSHFNWVLSDTFQASRATNPMVTRGRKWASGVYQALSVALGALVASLELAEQNDVPKACLAVPCHPMPSHAIPCHPMQAMCKERRGSLSSDGFPPSSCNT